MRRHGAPRGGLDTNGGDVMRGEWSGTYCENVRSGIESDDGSARSGVCVGVIWDDSVWDVEADPPGLWQPGVWV